MHPIEYLRHVARASGADPTLLVRETASALRAMRLDQPGMVLATRRIVDKHPTCAPLWWLCAGALSSLDPTSRLAELVAEFDADRTDEHFAAIAGEELLVDSLVMDALAMGEEDSVEVLLGVHDAEDLDWALEVGRPTILVARKGSRLPLAMWQEMKRRSMDTDNPWALDVRVVQASRFDHVVGPQGTQRGVDASCSPECAPCPELLVGGGL